MCQAAKSAGRFAEAEALAARWAELSGPAGLPSEAVLAWNAAHEAARSTGDIEKALEYLDRSVELARRLDYAARLPESWYSRAELLARAGRPVQAIEASQHIFLDKLSELAEGDNALSEILGLSSRPR